MRPRLEENPVIAVVLLVGDFPRWDLCLFVGLVFVHHPYHVVGGGAEAHGVVVMGRRFLIRVFRK